MPVTADDEKIYPDCKKLYTTDVLNAFITLYSEYRDIQEREILVEYVDYAIDMLEHETESSAPLRLLTELAEIGRKSKITIPTYINERLENLLK